MDRFEFASSIASSLAWPLLVLFLVMYFRMPLKKLITNLIRLKFKDVEVSFSEKISDLPNPEAANANANLTETTESTKYKKLLDVSPKAAVIGVYAEIESAAKLTVEKLLPKYPSRTSSIEVLLSSQCLNMDDSNLLNELRKLRNAAAHTSEEFISKEDGAKYVNIAIGLISTIRNISRIRKIKLSSLTVLLFNLNMIIDKDEHKTVSIQEVRNHVMKRDVLEFLDSKFGNSIDLSLYLKSDTYLDFRNLYSDALVNIENAIDFDRKFGVANNGICALIAMTTQLIQQGDGWIENL